MVALGERTRMHAEIRDVQTSQTVRIPPEGRSFGRMGMNKADVEVPHNSVSSLHARVYAKNGAWYIEDLGSSNGTYLGSDKVEQPMRLSEGAKFSLSRYKYEVVRLPELDDDDETGAWKGYEEPSGPKEMDDSSFDEDATGARPALIEPSPTTRPPTRVGGGSMTPWIAAAAIIAIGGGLGAWMLMSSEGSAPDAQADGEGAQVEGSEAAQAGAAQPAGDGLQADAEAGEPADPSSPEDAPEDSAEAEGADADEPVAVFTRKLEEIESTLKTNKRLLKKKNVKKLYKQLQKKQKAVRAKLKAKAKRKSKRKGAASEPDRELYREAGPLVDQLHDAIFGG